MKKCIVVILALLLAVSAMAVDLKVKTGLNLATMLDKNETINTGENYKSQPSFHLGISAELPINNMFAVDAGVLLNGKGYHLMIDGNILLDDIDAKMNILYLDIPVLAKVKYTLGDLDLYAAVGPYIGIGLTGKQTSEAEILGITVRDTSVVEWGSDAGEYKTLDMGLSMGVGVVYNTFEIGISYQMGLISTSGITTDNYKRKNRVFAISLGYFINKE